MPGYTHDGRRHALSIARLLQARRYMLAVGPPRSEMTPVNPGTLSRTAWISRSTESSERLWMMRPSCSVIERSEEHTSELQSRFDLVCRLLLEKKKKITT